MTSRVAALATLGLLVAAAVLRSALAWERLPETLASHFGASGEPNGWATRAEFFTLFATFTGGAVVFLLAIPMLVRVVPQRLVSLPNRDYWLAPERRDECLRKLGTQAAWFATGTVAFAVGVLELTLRANVARGPLEMGPTWTLLGAYLAFCALWIAGLWRSFRRE